MTVRLITLSLRQVLRLLLLTCRSSRSKDLELLVLRQELAVLRRQVPHPKTRREERLVLTVLQRLRPLHERLSNLDVYKRQDRARDGGERSRSHGYEPSAGPFTTCRGELRCQSDGRRGA